MGARAVQGRAPYLAIWRTARLVDLLAEPVIGHEMGEAISRRHSGWIYPLAL